MGIVEYLHTHVLIQLVEGPPPKYYYQSDMPSNRAKLDRYLDDLRRREIKFTL